MIGALRGGLAVVLVLIASSPAIGAAEEKYRPETYFTPTPRLGVDDIRDLRGHLERARHQCTGAGARIDRSCEPAVEVLKTVFGGIFRKSLPDLLIHIEEVDGALEVHPPLLIWNEKSTPYVFGARHVFVLIISDRRLPLDARLTTIVETVANPFAALQTLLDFTPAQPDVPQPKTGEAGISWDRLSLDEAPPLWIGGARLAVEQGSINRLTISQRGETVSRTVTEEAGKPTATKTERKAQGPEPLPDDSLDLPFRELAAHFSNSRSSRAAFGVAFGATFDADDTVLGDTSREIHENAYALAKAYLVRPRLQVGPESKSLYRPSLGVFVGTNVTDDPFDEILVGISAGHLVGNLGVVVGINLVEGAGSVSTMADGEPELEKRGREAKIFAGLEYSF